MKNKELILKHGTGWNENHTTHDFPRYRCALNKIKIKIKKYSDI